MRGASSGARTHRAADGFADEVARAFDVVFDLELEPEIGRGREVAREAQRQLGIHHALAGEQVLIRVAGAANATGSFQLSVGPDASIGGRITAADGGAPIESVTAKIFEEIIDEEQVHYNYFDAVGGHIERLGAVYLAKIAGSPDRCLGRIDSGLRFLRVFTVGSP